VAWRKTLKTFAQLRPRIPPLGLFSRHDGMYARKGRCHSACTLCLKVYKLLQGFLHFLREETSLIKICNVRRKIFFKAKACK
jgi:hypothetical protein